MDLFGNQITLATRLVDTGVPIEQIAQLLVPGNIDNNQLADILNYLNISLTGLDNSNQAKQYKLLQVLDWDGCTLGYIAELHKVNKRQQIATMLVSFVTAVRRSTMASTPVVEQAAPGNSDALTMLATNLQVLTSHISQLPAQLATLSLGSSSGYSKSPTSPPPSFDPNSSSVSLLRFVETRYLRWVNENKLHPTDTFLYLHKIFPAGSSQDRAYEIIQRRAPSETLEMVTTKLAEYFRISSETEKFDMLQTFLCSKVNPACAEEDFQRLFELQASIQCQDGMYDETRCLVLTKTQFCRALRCHSTMISQALKVMSTGPDWSGTSTLHDTLKLIHRISAQYKSGNGQETLGASRTNSVGQTPITMECDNIRPKRSFKKKLKGVLLQKIKIYAFLVGRPSRGLTAPVMLQISGMQSWPHAI